MTYQSARELDYGFSIAVQCLVKAMGMFSENMQRQHRGESMAYVEDDFDKLIDQTGVHHNGVLTRWQSHD